MSTSIESFPPELLMRIFEYFSDDRKRIGQFRLVSKTFTENSSPYLITKLVFAKRLKTLAKAMELACHPYFSRCVTEITYDLSFWKSHEDDPDGMHALEDYCAECEDAEEINLRHFFDEEWHRRARCEDMFYSSLNIGSDAQPNAASAFLQGTGHDCPESPIHPCEDYALQEAWDEKQSGRPDRDRMGCFKGFQEYQRHRVFDRKLFEGGEYLLILADIASKLPKLRAVTFTDYRGLAGESEFYSDLCARLFGNMLEPERWNWQLDSDGLCTVEAINALLVLARRGPEAGLQSISFGPHGYEMTSFPEETLVTHKEPHYLDFEQIEPDRSDDDNDEFRRECPDSWMLGCDWKSIFRNLRSARMPFLIPRPPGLLEMSTTMMDALPDTIRHLATSVRGPVEGSFAGEVMTEQMIRPFDELVAKHRFPHLETLELEGWCINIQSLQDFLLPHAATLRQLHLINIQLTTRDDGQEEDQDTLAAFVAKELRLTGIEIMEVDFYGTIEYGPSSPVNALPWLIPSNPDLHFWDGDKFIKGSPAYAVENACMDGKRNRIRRRRLPFYQGGDELGDKHSHY
ncbi:hypothetical protein Q7P37_000415 [Cladosporium fusiforme]